MDFQNQAIVISQLSPDNPMTPPVENGNGGSDLRPAKFHSPIRKRAAIACKRCRRLRSKCVHEKAVPPCNACRNAGGGAESCRFPVRGEFDSDRFYRHPRQPVLRKSRRNANKVPRDSVRVSAEPSGAPDEWDLLPPVSEVIDGINVFTRHYFQLGFISRDRLASRHQHDPRSVSPFLLMSILSISARLTPALVQRFGSGTKASEAFMGHATQLSEKNVYGQPSLETCQAFFLLGIAQHRAGWKNLSYINAGISIRMAVLMGLHREETYALIHPTSDLVAKAESARRTLWMLYNQDHLLSWSTSPAALSSSDISTLLPCDEADFAAGRQPSSRAALEDTPRAHGNSRLTIDSSQSIFASLIQVRHYWGTICRRAINIESDPHPWDLRGTFEKMAVKLKWWENGLPNAHVWNPSLLRGYRSTGQDMAYLEIVMVTRLCNIVLRRPYLQDILNLDSKGRGQQSYFSDMSYNIFSNVESLFEVVEAWFADSGPEGSMGAETGLFCVYVCGLFSTYLMRYPNVCSDVDLSHRGCGIHERAKSILAEAEKSWPMALRWLRTLDKAHRRLEAERAEINARDPTPLVLPGPTTLLAAHGLLSPTLPPLALPETSQHPYAGGSAPPTAALATSSLAQTTALPPIYQAPAYPVSHPSPSSVGSFSLGGSSAHPITPQSVHESVDVGYRFPPAALGPDNDGFEAELRFYLSGEESGSRVFGFL